MSLQCQKEGTHCHLDGVHLRIRTKHGKRKKSVELLPSDSSNSSCMIICLAVLTQSDFLGANGETKAWNDIFGPKFLGFNVHHTLRSLDAGATAP